MDRFLQTRITYEPTYTIKDVLNELCKDIFFWIHETPELECEYEESTFKRKFYLFVYQTYNNQKKEDFIPYDEELYEYFSLKFSQDIIDLFMGFKELTRSYNLSLFHKKDVSLDLQEFLFDHLLIEDPYVDSDDEENNIDSSIDD